MICIVRSWSIIRAVLIDGSTKVFKNGKSNFLADFESGLYRNDT